MTSRPNDGCFIIKHMSVTQALQQYCPGHIPVPRCIQITTDGNFAINGNYHGNRAQQPIEIKVSMVLTIDGKVTIDANLYATGPWWAKLGLYYIALYAIGYPFTHGGELQVWINVLQEGGIWTLNPWYVWIESQNDWTTVPRDIHMLTHVALPCTKTMLRHSGIYAETLNVTGSLNGIQMSHKMTATWMSYSRPHDPITFNLHESRGKRLPFRLAVSEFCAMSLSIRWSRVSPFFRFLFSSSVRICNYDIYVGSMRVKAYAFADCLTFYFEGTFVSFLLHVKYLSIWTILMYLAHSLFSRLDRKFGICGHYKFMYNYCYLYYWYYYYLNDRN